MTIDDFFRGQGDARQLFEAVYAAAAACGPVDLKVSNSQVAFLHQKAFAWAWMPGMYLKRNTAPLVLTFSFRQRDESPRWKQVVQPAPGWFTHHLELYSLEDVDAEVQGWLQKAWTEAG